MQEYNFKQIEEKWQKIWDRDKSFKAVDFHPTKPKYYALYEFPNISGDLHMGHLKGTVPADVLARFKRFNGYNVLFPIGGDAFGMPAENAAIKRGIDPEVFAATGMKKIMDQFKLLGLSFDYDRTIATSDADYYKWTQWIFLKLFKEGKAYKQEGTVNFCPNCKTVLSNEDSQDGKCDRCNGEVVQEKRWVWFLKMKEYSEKLLKNVENIEMTESLKEAQRNWIGRSEGAVVKFNIVDSSNNLLGDFEIFTTCIETIYGITFMVLAPEHKLVEKLKANITNYKEVENYVKETKNKTELQRISDSKNKSGVELGGLYAVNPVNGKKVPIFLGDFVIASYGTGAVMAVPSHDQRDYEFAAQFKIPYIQVIEGDTTKQAVEKGEYIPKNSKMMNSEEFNGLPVIEAKKKIAEKLVKQNLAKIKVDYKMQDWAFNRQRFWGEPFPIVFCEKCGTVPLDEKYLPLTLPKVKDYTPDEKGNSALSKAHDWVNCNCPKCKGPAKRETDTMPNWAGSSWYWIRYTDPLNKEKIADFEKLKYWGQVDCYTGGTEHITRHVLYSFFWQNFLYEIGAVPTRDPFKRKMGSGLILDSEGKKMSKSSTNGASPLDVIAKYGTDTARLHLHFLGGYEDNTPWTYAGIEGIENFFNRVWKLPDMIKGDDVSNEHAFELNKLIKKIGEDYEDLKLNTAIAAFMTFIKKIREDGWITREELKQFLILLNPLAPHITSELFEIVFNKNILGENWPKLDETKLVATSINLPVQINGKMKGTIEVSPELPQVEVEKLAKAKFNIGEAKKVIFVKGRIINFIVQ